MQKIVIDTNVLVSALIQRSFPFYITNEIFLNINIQVCLSDQLFHEYYAVLNREKFAKYPDFIANAQFILGELDRISIKYSPKRKVTILSDGNDNTLLELSRESKADYLITGNHRDFTIKDYFGTKIVSPKDYYLEYMLK